MMLKRFRRWIDLRIYWLFWRRWNRILRDEPGYAVLLHEWLTLWLAKEPPEEGVEKSARLFARTQFAAREAPLVEDAAEERTDE